MEKNLKRDPQLLEVLLYPHPALKEVSKLVTTSIPDDTDLQNLIADMQLTLKQYNALGLAAIQVGVPLRLLLVRDIETNIVHTIINPVLKKKGGNSFESEGCLSLPGVFMRILRPSLIEIEYLDETGNKKIVSKENLLARAILHEMDHLDGLTFLDRMNIVQRNAALNKLKKIKRTLFSSKV